MLYDKIIESLLDVKRAVKEKFGDDGRNKRGGRDYSSGPVGFDRIHYEIGRIAEAIRHAKVAAGGEAGANGDDKVDKSAVGENTQMSIGYGDTEVILSNTHTTEGYYSQLRMTPGEVSLLTFDEAGNLVTNLNVNKNGKILLLSGDTEVKVDGGGAYLNGEEIATMPASGNVDLVEGSEWVD
jgi:hypothetical protein